MHNLAISVSNLFDALDFVNFEDSVLLYWWSHPICDIKEHQVWGVNIRFKLGTDRAIR